MAASTSSFSKLSAPLRHLILRQSAVSLTGKLAADRALPAFAPFQKPVFAGANTVADIVADNMMLFKQVDSPVTRTAFEMAKEKKEDADDEDVPSGSDFDGSDDEDVDDCSDFDDDFEDSDDVDVSGEDE